MVEATTVDSPEGGTSFCGPENVADLVLHCVICTQPVPMKRARGRSKDTCSPACNVILRAHRKHVNNSSKCPTCWHPSTPEERKEFIAWRKARGDRREKRGRPAKAKGVPTDAAAKQNSTADAATEAVTD